jgi:hypothetical protein
MKPIMKDFISLQRIKYCKDGINDFVMTGNSQSVNPKNTGTKASFLLMKF